MNHRFSVIAGGCELPANTVEDLDDVGLVVISDPTVVGASARIAYTAIDGGAQHGTQPSAAGALTRCRWCLPLV